jgi:hypothetical protein
VVRAFVKRMAEPLHWIKNNDEEKIKAFFGSRQAWESIPDWRHYTYTEDEPAEPQEVLDLKSFTMEEIQTMARIRGGECLSKAFVDIKTKLPWRCAFGHEWDATPVLIRAGHWCPECAAPPWDYDTQAKADPLLGKFYYNNHDIGEYQKVDYLYCACPMD